LIIINERHGIDFFYGITSLISSNLPLSFLQPPPLSSTKVAAFYSLEPPTAAQASSLAAPTSNFLSCRASLLCHPLLPHHVFLPCHVVVRRRVLHHCRDLQFSLSLSLKACLVGDDRSQIAAVATFFNQGRRFLLPWAAHCRSSVFLSRTN